MNVAVFLDQHSVRFGQRASSQTVATPLAATTRRVVAITPVGIGRRNHGGNRRPRAGEGEEMIGSDVKAKLERTTE